MKDWRTTLGGAINNLGKALRGIPAGMVAFGADVSKDPHQVKMMGALYLIGLVVSAIGNSISTLFSADAKPQQDDPPTTV